jgi:type II secretory pathway pseudopilin PulG
MTKPVPTRPIRHSEEGYTILLVIFLLAVLILAISVAVPRVTRSIQRDREVETMERGEQYIRAIRLYYRKFGAYPPSVDALVKTNNIRFLRKKYVDPTTGKEEWKAIQFGQNKAPTVMGFFGQPMAGSTLAGIGSSGGNTITGASSLGSSFMSSGSSSSDSTSATGSASGTSDNSAAASTASASGTTGSTGSGSSSISGTTTSATSGTGLTGKSFGGAGIIGFSPNSPKQSILVYKKKNHYNEWEFVYDPASEKMVVGGSSGTNVQSGSSGIPSTTSTLGGSSSTSTSTTP